jgi:hypothetical protein
VSSDLLERPGSLVHRYYDPATEQFLSVDPLVDQTGMAYAFTEGDPVNESDQLGLFPGQGFLDRVRHDLIAGNDAASHWLNNQANRIGCENGLGNGVFASAFNCGDSASSSSCPAAAGTLNPGSSEADARSALESQGVDIPSNYYGSPSRSGNGWVFRPDVSTNDDNSIRIMEQGADPQYPNGYYRLYDSKGDPVDGTGTPLGTSGVGQAETHFPLDPDPLP